MTMNYSFPSHIIFFITSARMVLNKGFCCLIGSLILYQFMLPTVIHSAQSPPTHSDKKISNYKIKIRRLQEGISNQEAQVQEATQKETSILAEIEVLDKKLGTQQEKLDELQIKMEKQQTLIKKEEVALGIIRKEKNIVENHLKKRISSYYTMGHLGLLNVTFSTKTLPELLTFSDSFNTLIKYDQDVIQVYRETIKELEKIKKALDLEKEVLENFIAQTVQEKKILEGTKGEKSTLLIHVRTQTALHKRAIEEMSEASKQLSDEIITIKTKEQSYEKGFLSNKGNLPPPIDGTLITRFNQETTNKLGISRKCQGIELQALDGTKIKATGNGKVIFAGYLRGYGNTVIIHHGFQYYTITSRIEKILTKKGTKVKKEEIIGIMGDSATLFEEGLYFEIRYRKKSLDPLLWLNPHRLSTKQEKTN